MNLREVILRSAADCFANHRGEEFTIRELYEKYDSKSKPTNDQKKKWFWSKYHHTIII